MYLNQKGPLPVAGEGESAPVGTEPTVTSPTDAQDPATGQIITNKTFHQIGLLVGLAVGVYLISKGDW